MTKIMGSPSRYVQGYDEILNIEKYIVDYADSFLIIIDKFLYDDLSKKLKNNLSKYKVVCEKFGGESSKSEINRLNKIYKENGLKMVIGIGTGKTIDTAKTIALHHQECPVVICPTAASCDAPCSASAVIYKDSGEFEEYVYFKKNPDIILVDTNICSKAPVRLLVAGMGDALATYFEARSTSLGDHKNRVDGYPTVAGLKLAQACYETLLEDGYKAKIAVENKVCTRAVENIIETNILLSGLGFESGGLAAAHAIYNALTIIPETRKFFHGEKVAFGTLVQLILENAPQEEIDEVLEFCYSVGLPLCLADLDVTKIDGNQIMQVAERSCAESDTMHNMQFAVTPRAVYDAIIAANIYGTNFKNCKLKAEDNMFLQNVLDSSSVGKTI